MDKRGRAITGTLVLVTACLLTLMGRGPRPTLAQVSGQGDPERGRLALTTQSFLPAAWKREAFERVRDRIGPDAPDPGVDPAGYRAAFQDRYGLHPAPYPNHDLPMGLRLAPGKRDAPTGLHIDCLVCHGGSIGGQSYIGLGNTQLDLDPLLKDLAVANGERPPIALFTLNSTRGTNNAGMIDVALLTLRNPDLSFRTFPLLTGANIPELDTPAWWLLKKKRTKYYDGRTPAQAVRSNMQFLLGDLTRAQFEALEPTFGEIDAYIRSLTPPAYPFPVNTSLARTGEAVFTENCSHCHGTYGSVSTYPNKIVPLDVIKTDPARAKGLSDKFVAHYNASWFGEIDKVDETCQGYQAPPLDGIWATAPYLHNGSVPTLELLLNSPKRPTKFTRPRSTEFTEYDPVNVGWTFEAVELVDPTLNPREKKRIVDTARFGLGNQGHTFGDSLSEEDRRALIEYLKTL